MARVISEVPKPWTAVVEPVKGVLSITREWYNFFDGFVRTTRLGLPLSGTVTFAAATTAAVAFTTAELDTNYNVHIEAPEDRRWWITSKATTGFTINLSSASSATFGWSIIRR